MFETVPSEHMWLIVFLAFGLAVIFCPPWSVDEEK
jgi:hypothetical protein